MVVKSFMKKNHVLIIIFVLFCSLLFVNIRFLSLLDIKWWDFLQRVFPEKASDRIYIVAIDDAALNRFGRWPFERSLLADLISRINEHGPKYIGLDIVFPETSSGDETLASSIFWAGNVVGSVFLPGKPSDDKNLEELEYFPAAERSDKAGDFSFVGNVDVIAQSLVSRGHVKLNSDFDGPVRHYGPFYFYKGRVIWGMAFDLFRLYKGLEMSDISIGVNEIKMGDISVPTNDNKKFMIHFTRHEREIKYIPMTEFYEEGFRYDLNDSIVLVGLTSVGLHDYRPSPISPSMPGIEIEAMIVNNLLTGNILKPHRVFNYLVILFCMLILGYIFVRVNKEFNLLRGVLSLFFVFLVYTGIQMFFFGKLRELLHFFIPNLFFLALFGYHLAYYYLVSSKGARELKMILSHYLSPNVMHELVKNPGLVKLGGNRTAVAILFGDVAGFTTYSESHSPEEVVKMLNIILTKLTNSVFEFKGTLDKYIGDCIMAFWGAPLPDKAACDHCVLACIDMIDAIKEMNKGLEEKFYIGIGVNYGDAVIGNMGSDKVYDYTAMGDTVNTASRVEGLTRTLNNALVLTKDAFDKLSDELKTRFELHPEKMSVKGKAEGLTVYKLIGYPLKDV